MKPFPEHFPALQDDRDPDHEFLVKLIPFVGPGAAVFFLFVVYLVLDVIFVAKY